jgi:hypothetical protein
VHGASFPVRARDVESLVMERLREVKSGGATAEMITDVVANPAEWRIRSPLILEGV